MKDLIHDETVGFKAFTTDDIDDMGAEGLAKALKKRLGNGPVYLSFDIDTIDPSMAPGSECVHELELTASWHSRVRRLDNARSQTHHPLPRRPQHCRRRYCRGVPGIRHQRRAHSHGSINSKHRAEAEKDSRGARGHVLEADAQKSERDEL